MNLLARISRAAVLMACTLPLAALAQYSTPMRNVDNPDRFPYQENTSFSLDPPYVNGFGFVPTPAGKRYVIEFVSLNCHTPSASDSFPQQHLSITKALSPTSSIGYSLMLSPLVRGGPSPFGGYVWSSQTQLKVYSDPVPATADGGSGIYLNVFHTDSSVRGSCNAVVSGHSVTP